MTILHSAARVGFNTRALSIMDEIEYRRVTTAEDLEPVRQLRQASYLRGKVFSDPPPAFADPSDLDPSVYVFAIYYREQLVATLRIHILTPENRVSHSNDYFGDVLEPLLDQGLTFMDPTRFAIEHDVPDAMFVLPHITLRLGFLAAKHFATDYCLSMVREGHGGFYRKVFRSTQLTPYRTYDSLAVRASLFSSPKSMEQVICADYPMFRSLEVERRLLYDDAAPGLPKVLSVRPSARAALRLHGDLKQTG